MILPRLYLLLFWFLVATENIASVCYFNLCYGLDSGFYIQLDTSLSSTNPALLHLFVDSSESGVC